MAISCKSCDSGSMDKKKVYRLSGYVVGIGYLLLISGVLGALISLLLIFGGAGAASGETRSQNVSLADLLLDATILGPVEDIEIGEPLDLIGCSGAGPSADQKEEANGEVLLDSVGDAVGIMSGGMAVVILIMSIIGSLLGWLLVMKKRILQCRSCGAVVAAS